MIEPCVKVLWVKVRVYVCVCAEDRVEQRRRVHNEDGEVPGSHVSGPDTEETEHWPQAHKGPSSRIRPGDRQDYVAG